MNIRDVLRDLRIEFREHGESPHVTESCVGIKCPFCGKGTSNYGLGIFLRNLKVSCWRCGGHNLVSTLAEASGEPRGAVAALLGGVAPDRTEAPPPGKYSAPAGVGPLGAVHRRYLENRGLDPDEMVRMWGLGGIGWGGRLQWRLFLPIVHEGVPLSWTTRAVGDVPHTERYRGASREQSAVPRGDLLYGEDYCRTGIVVTEGPFSVYRIGPGAACTCGVGFSQHQVIRIARFPVRAICFDGESKAQQRARKLAAELSVFPGATHVVTMSGPQPDTSPPDEINELRRRFLD